MTDKLLAQKLKKLRESLGFTLKESAQKLGFVNYQTLMSIEDGTREVKASELAKFAKIYYCSLTNLLSDSKEDNKILFLWRSEPSDKAVKKRIESKIINICENYSLLEKLLNIRTNKGFFNITIDDIRNNHNIDELAESISSLLNLGSRPACSLRHILEQDYSIKIIYQELEEGSAISTIHPNAGFTIVINSKESQWRQNFDLAHELFHILTWDLTINTVNDPNYYAELDKKADRFASTLLLPKKEVEKEINKIYDTNLKITISDLVDISKDFEVSVQALIYRLVNIRFITFDEAIEIQQDVDLTELRKKGHKKKQPQERLNNLAIKCLRNGLISRGKFAEITEIDRIDIDNFIEKLGLMKKEGRKIEFIPT